MSSNTNLLLPKVFILQNKLTLDCYKKGISYVVTQTLRTKEEQNILYAQGRTVPGTIVTNAKGGQSMHNYGIAFDVCPVIGSKLMWNRIDLFDKIGAIGMKLGLEWGGSWDKFQDKPHFELTLGYTTDDFVKKKVDFTKWN